ncbi:MAG: hypothetical protein GWN01_09215 [Nitrosopumilaceae archaeon]|nr:hypothetical protein [Nitrosopumilaceae archaeon]NIU87789.1 hypothetical protein [Nitrosopumilaceae archaeon]NIV65172.1 hypothetical protein [Nitrosopumilaceae archaeon]NIX61687.1 hypothetical protein [Nitrosopumilaceae archaeon]
MSVITKAIFDRMANDTILTNQLGVYASAPSIFTKIPLPSDFDTKLHAPYILTTGEVSVDPGPTDVKNASGRELLRDIRTFAPIKDSPSIVESITERIRDLFHRQNFIITGFTIIVSEITGPVVADEEDVIGRIQTLRLMLTEP